MAADKSTWKKINWLERQEIVEYLEANGIACYPDESIQTLRQALFDAVEQGDIELND